jgi:geranylgeranyl pyrophosphate synthase
MKNQNCGKNKKHLEFSDIFRNEIEKNIFFYLESFGAPALIGKNIIAGKNKFRSALPFLLSKNRKDGVAIGISAELSWGGIIILDDIGDLSETRRGLLSSWKEYGLLKSSHAALMSIQIAEFVLQENKLEKLSRMLKESVYETLSAQIEQDDFDFHTASNEVLNNYLRKTSLGRWAIDAVIANESDNISAKEKTALTVFNQLVSVASQIKNDLDDFRDNSEYEPFLKDVYSKTISYPISLFFEKALVKDKKIFMKKYWGRNNLNVKEVVNLFEKYKVITLSQSRMKILLGESLSVMDIVRNNCFKKNLSEWIKPMIEFRFQELN